MIRRLFMILYATEPIVFRTDFPLEQAVSSLRSATSKSMLHSLTREAATGTVTKKKVSLQRAIPFAGNSFKPFFIGRFSAESGKIVLQGRFTMHWMAKAFMTFWFGLCMLWTLLALFAVITKPTELWFVPLFGLGMLFAGVAGVRLGKWFARNDRQYLCDVITKALT